MIIVIGNGSVNDDQVLWLMLGVSFAAASALGGRGARVRGMT